jgi:hypothetical protein
MFLVAEMQTFALTAVKFLVGDVCVNLKLPEPIRHPLMT